MTDHDIEQEIQAKGLTAPRVTPNDVESNIQTVHYFTAEAGVVGEKYLRDEGHVELDEALAPDLSLLTFCVIVLKNGYTVTGESACASPENFDADIGRMIARSNAVAKIWPLMGYELKQRLHEASE